MVVGQVFGLVLSGLLLFGSDKVFERYMARTKAELITQRDADLYMKQYQSFAIVSPVGLALIVLDIFVLSAGNFSAMGAFGLFLFGVSVFSLAVSFINGLRPSKFEEINDYIETMESEKMLSEDNPWNY